MIRGFYTAGTGLRAQQTSLDNISNNLANVNTVAYKATTVNFSDLMYQNLNRPTAENPAMVGHGVKVSGTGMTMGMGALDTSNRVLDFYLPDENGFFALMDANGDITYTRAGNFIMSTDDEGDTFYLAAANGDRVLDEDEGEIELEWDEETGELDFDPSVIGVFRFSNPYGLALMGDNRYGVTDLSGEAEAIEDPTVVGGSLEKSTVDLSYEMVKMIESSKAFSFNSRMVQVADEIEQTINQLR